MSHYAETREIVTGKGKTDGLTPEQRRERDAKALQEKLAKKASKESSGALNGTNGIKNKK